MKSKVDPRALANEVIQRTAREGLSFAVFHRRGSSYDYFLVRGCFLEEGVEAYVRQIVEMISPDASSHDKEEVLAHIRDAFLRDRAKVEAEGVPFWGLENGVADVHRGRVY